MKSSLIIFFLPFLVFAQSGTSGGLTRNVIEDIQGSVRLSKSEYAIMNAVTNNKLSELSLNRSFFIKHNDLFSHRIKTKGITDQKRSGRCWLFAGLNMLRPGVIEKYNLKNFEFSQSYLYFWDKLEKANRFLEFIITSYDRGLLDRELVIFLERPVFDGGYWSYVVNLIDKYGVVPNEAMPETYNSNNSWVMNSIISRKLREDAVLLRKMAQEGKDVQELRDKKIEMLKTIYKILVLNLGEPPSEFIWRYEDTKGNVSAPKRYTPEEFYKDVVGVDIRDYVALFNYPGKVYNRLYQCDNVRNIFEYPDPVYINLDIEQLKELTKKSVLDDEPIWFACDIIKDKDSEHGILSTRILDYRSLYGLEMELNKEARILFRESAGNHAMVFTGVDLQDNRPVKWWVEDSHGKDSGDNGHWVMYDDWFDEYVYAVIINKKYLPGELRNILKQEPIHLPPWDPMACLLRNIE